MQFFSLLILCSGLYSPAYGKSVTLSPCQVGAPCQSGFTCKPVRTSPSTSILIERKLRRQVKTASCGGGCTTSISTPPLTLCTVGDNKPCGTASTCTSTQLCTGTFAHPCRGICKYSPTAPGVTACNVGTNTCGFPSSYCTPPGTCTATPSIYSVGCTVGNDAPCPSGGFCTPTQTCSGLCSPLSTGIPPPTTTPSVTPPTTPSPTPTPTGKPCGGYHKPCPWGEKCVAPNGLNCGYDPNCHGVCVPV